MILICFIYICNIMQMLYFLEMWLILFQNVIYFFLKIVVLQLDQVFIKLLENFDGIEKKSNNVIMFESDGIYRYI